MNHSGTAERTPAVEEAVTELTAIVLRTATLQLGILYAVLGVSS
jgi:hypothetical protein